MTIEVDASNASYAQTVLTTPSKPEMVNLAKGPAKYLSPARTMDPVETVVIEHRAFVRDCLVRCLVESGFSKNIVYFATVNDLLRDGYNSRESTIFLLCTGERPIADIEHDCARLAAVSDVNSKIILLASGEDTNCVWAALRGGVKGYIPMSIPFDVAIEAIHLVRAGGIFIPPSCITNSSCSVSLQPVRSAVDMLFTSRQALVIEAMCKGKSNKIIAYELKMAEATVKVHVRNIMRKLKARNRTEVAFLINAMH